MVLTAFEKASPRRGPSSVSAAASMRSASRPIVIARAGLNGAELMAEV